MSNANPESKFIVKDLSAYEGMTIGEYTFCRFENCHGEMQDYKLDVISAPNEPTAPRPVVILEICNSRISRETVACVTS